MMGGSTMKYGILVAVVILCTCIVSGAPGPDETGITIQPEMADTSIGTGELRYSTKTSMGEYFTETYPEPDLTALAEDAIAAAPSWMEDDLVIAFTAFDDDDQDRFASKILNAAQPEYRDEIAFTIAHMLTNHLTKDNFDDRFLDVNVQWIYDLDTHLEYVRLVEYGDPTQGGTDYYTTTAYIMDEGSGPYEVEIPRDIYYWWVVHPGVTEERPAFINPATAQITTPENGGYHWRQYFWESDAVNDYRTNGSWECHLYGEVALLPTYLWDGQPHGYPSGREFTADCFGLDIITNWVLDVVHWGATSPRPVQPVAIAYDHDGNCGEYQDILGAAIRTGLVPSNGTITIRDDHVWNEFWLNDWVPIQDSDATSIGSYGVGADYTYGGWKDISAAYAQRGDGLKVDRTASYTEHCTITTTVVDSTGNPIDGANVSILGQSYYNPNDFGVCIEGYTDTDGILVLDMGDNRDFKGKVYTNIGFYGTEGDGITIADDTVPDTDYAFDVVIDGIMTVPQVTDLGNPPSDLPRWRFTADIDVPHAIRYGLKKSPTGSDLIRTARVRVEPGSTGFFLCDDAELANFKAGMPFDAYAVEPDGATYNSEITLNKGHWTFVISNRHHHGHREIVRADLQLEYFADDEWMVMENIQRSVSLEPGEIYTVSFGDPMLDLAFDLPAQTFSEGDEFYVDLAVANGCESDIDADLYVLLDALGEYFFFPTWISINAGLDYMNISVPAGSDTVIPVIDTFIMPAVPPVGPFYFYGVAFDPGTLAIDAIVSDIVVADFSLL
jgi:hypothetical protein